MELVRELVGLLESMAGDPTQLAAAVERFQSTVWNSTSQDLRTSPEIEDTLRTLAYDLDYYVSDPVARSEDSSYYGEERALQEIRQALSRLRSLGAA